MIPKRRQPRRAGSRGRTEAEAVPPVAGQPLRSWLFVPGDSERKQDKALGSAADAVEFGSRVTLKGKSEKGSDGAGTLRVEATLASHGTCAPGEPPGPEPGG